MRANHGSCSPINTTCPVGGSECGEEPKEEPKLSRSDPLIVPRFQSWGCPVAVASIYSTRDSADIHRVVPLRHRAMEALAFLFRRRIAQDQDNDDALCPIIATDLEHYPSHYTFPIVRNRPHGTTHSFPRTTRGDTPYQPPTIPASSWDHGRRLYAMLLLLGNLPRARR